MRRFIKYALIVAAILAFYYNSYIGLGIVGIAFLAYIGRTGKPVYKTNEEMKKEDDLENLTNYITNPAYSSFFSNIHHKND